MAKCDRCKGPIPWGKKIPAIVEDTTNPRRVTIRQLYLCEDCAESFFSREEIEQFRKKKRWQFWK